MKRIILLFLSLVLIVSQAVSVYATISKKGETAHPIFSHKFTFE